MGAWSKTVGPNVQQGAAYVFVRGGTVWTQQGKLTAADGQARDFLGGSVAVSGLTAGTKLPTTVFPFILRGVNLLGIDSVYCPMETRLKTWNRLATDFKPANLEELIQQEVTLQQLPDALPTLLKGDARGRIIVKL